MKKIIITFFIIPIMVFLSGCIKQSTNIQQLPESSSTTTTTLQCKKLIDYNKVINQQYFKIDDLEVAFVSRFPPIVECQGTNVNVTCVGGYTGSVGRVYIVIYDGADIKYVSDVCNHEYCHTQYHMSSVLEDLTVCNDELNPHNYTICTKFIGQLRNNGYIEEVCWVNR